MLEPLSIEARCELFGRPGYTADPQHGNPEHVRLDPSWVHAVLVGVHVPELKRLGVGTQRVHRLAAAPLIQLWGAWAASGLDTEVKTWNGLFAPRFKRGRSGPDATIADLSVHAWGAAFDIDAQLYPLGRKVADDDPIMRRVEIANRLGWAWGGHFVHRPDGMHFEYVGLPA